MFRIFIGWDSRFPEPADVLRYSLLKHSSIPLDVRYLKLDELKINRTYDPLASTEFTYSRFLPPHLCNFQGKALFLDNDMLCLSDIREIAELDMTDYALRVVQHDYSPSATTKMNGVVQTTYPRKNWSSMMLMNCEKLTLWTKDVVETATGAYLHRFQDIPDEQIGELPKTWNTLDTMDKSTKLIHWTSGGPWFEQTKNCPHADVWLAARDEMRAAKKTADRIADRATPSRPHVPAPLSVSMPNGVSPIAR
jgi:lipopolysaccharide biosynthesis glycosyltransferase